MAAAKVVEDPAHQPIGHSPAPHRRVGLDVGHDDGGVIDVVVGDRDDAAVDDQLVAFAAGIVPNRVVDLLVWLHHPCSLAGNVNGTAPPTP